uniref:Uncharacterized protein n=1 Tax=Panagrolaimus superbus TaxID=310955 RepID=A0A914XUV1_9BILA
MLKAMFSFILFILTLTAISLLYNLEIDQKDVSTYVVITVVFLAVVTMIAAICYAINVKLRRRYNSQIPDDHISRIDEPSTGNPTITSRPTLNQDILQMIQRLQQFPDIVLRTLPTYNKAMFNSRPVRVTKKQGNTELPPEYITVTSPPPITAEDPAPPSYPNSLNRGMTRSVSFHPFQPSTSSTSSSFP